MRYFVYFAFAIIFLSQGNVFAAERLGKSEAASGLELEEEQPEATSELEQQQDAASGLELEKYFAKRLKKSEAGLGESEAASGLELEEQPDAASESDLSSAIEESLIEVLGKNAIPVKPLFDEIDDPDGRDILWENLEKIFNRVKFGGCCFDCGRYTEPRYGVVRLGCASVRCLRKLTFCPADNECLVCDKGQPVIFIACADCERPMNLGAGANFSEFCKNLLRGNLRTLLRTKEGKALVKLMKSLER